MRIRPGTRTNQRKRESLPMARTTIQTILLNHHKEANETVATLATVQMSCQHYDGRLDQQITTQLMAFWSKKKRRKMRGYVLLTDVNIIAE